MLTSTRQQMTNFFLSPPAFPSLELHLNFPRPCLSLGIDEVTLEIITHLVLSSPYARPQAQCLWKSPGVMSQVVMTREALAAASLVHFCPGALPCVSTQACGLEPPVAFVIPWSRALLRHILGFYLQPLPCFFLGQIQVMDSTLG